MKLPFDCMILDTKPQEVANRLTGQKVMLEPEAVAVYDCIIGAEIVGNYTMLRKGLDWFRKNYPKEYMILLD